MSKIVGQRSIIAATVGNLFLIALTACSTPSPTTESIDTGKICAAWWNGGRFPRQLRELAGSFSATGRLNAIDKYKVYDDVDNTNKKIRRDAQDREKGTFESDQAHSLTNTDYEVAYSDYLALHQSRKVEAESNVFFASSLKNEFAENCVDPRWPTPSILDQVITQSPLEAEKEATLLETANHVYACEKNRREHIQKTVYKDRNLSIDLIDTWNESALISVHSNLKNSFLSIQSRCFDKGDEVPCVLVSDEYNNYYKSEIDPTTKDWSFNYAGAKLQPGMNKLFRIGINEGVLQGAKTLSVNFHKSFTWPSPKYAQFSFTLDYNNPCELFRRDFQSVRAKEASERQQEYCDIMHCKETQ